MVRTFPEEEPGPVNCPGIPAPTDPVAEPEPVNYRLRPASIGLRPEPEHPGPPVPRTELPHEDNGAAGTDPRAKQTGGAPSEEAMPHKLVSSAIAAPGAWGEEALEEEEAGEAADADANLINE